MNIRIILMSIALAFTCAASAQLDSANANKLKEAQNLWVNYNNNSNWKDTTQFVVMKNDYIQVLSTDSTNAQANLGLGDLYKIMASYWTNMAMPLENTQPATYALYMKYADIYYALANPYLERYLRITGVTH